MAYNLDRDSINKKNTENVKMCEFVSNQCEEEKNEEEHWEECWMCDGAIGLKSFHNQIYLCYVSLYSYLPSWSVKLIDFIGTTQANIQSPLAPDLSSVKHLAVLILSASKQCCIQRPASPQPPVNNGLSAYSVKWGIKWNGIWFVFSTLWENSSCACLVNLGLCDHCHNYVRRQVIYIYNT